MRRKLKAMIVLNYGTQSDFASVANCRESFVSRIIRRRREPTPAIMEKWAALLECDVHEIFPG